MALGTMIAALALSQQTALGAIAWEPAGGDQAATYAIDPASIARDGDTVRFVLRATAHSPLPDGTSSAVVHYRIDCRALTVAAESANFYRPDGSFAYEHHAGHGWGEPEPIGAQRVQSDVFRRVCPGQ
jgi:hypothetical protein